MNTTIIEISNRTASIPIQLISETSLPQFIIPLFISSIITVYVAYTLFKNYIGSPMTIFYLFKFKRLTKRNTLLIRHKLEGIFGSDMILRSTINQVNKFLVKFKNKPFNLILNTPGGDVFATILLSKIFRNYPNKIDVYVPDYAMSGGSLLTLSCDKIHFNKHSCIGTIDPQVGDLFNFGSASAWKEVLKFKKNKVNDKSIIYHRVGKQVEDSIYNYVYSLIKDRCNSPKKLTNFLVKGGVEHIYQIDGNFLKENGINIIGINEKERKLLNKILWFKSEKTVFGI